MQTTAESSSMLTTNPLQQQVAEAMGNHSLPISKLLRLMWAIEADKSPTNENLRAQLRARIGAPLAS
ncbi:hypothetical protein [Methylobacterium haplocladii]|uniref:Uncharacterized protein n=1 Tax=Methylobacterium haplocladii TaxID=1176176 RepID=A0A512ILT4_9HYPH|nr:hypothetical protein [Methylobacterium haplocladii]GEO98635.1 hypothetical protein MHA02_10230 [Methylobacterium haplocladii]GJD83964.1 hypothetical protein HPGCJGGD_1839 [Methylobacterium haplocladii]GLS59470.1 hypothetical protein GCM10007887_21390 [Methylobacterium haplocladii]